MTVKEFLKMYPEACEPAVEWMKKNNITDMSDAWHKCKRPGWMVWALARVIELTKRDRVDIICRMYRVIESFLNSTSKELLQVGEKYVKGEVTEQDLARARARALALDLASARAIDLGLDLDLDLGLALDLAIALDLDRALERALAIAIARDLGLDLEQCKIIREMYPTRLLIQRRKQNDN